MTGNIVTKCLLGVAAAIVYAIVRHESSQILKDVVTHEQCLPADEPELRLSDAPILLWWTPFMLDEWHTEDCGECRCIFTQQRSALINPRLQAVLFYGSEFDPTDLPLPRKQNHEWALLHEESPKNRVLFSYDSVMSLFNHTSTFRQTSHFPLPLLHLKNMNVLNDTQYYVDVKEKNNLLSQLAPVVYIQSDCDTPLPRDAYVQELMKYIPIDSYGACLQNKHLPEHLQNPLESMNSDEFLHFVGRYKFTIAFENAVCEDYITEKLWRPLQVGSVPIYLGSPSIYKWLPQSTSAILANEFHSPKELASYLKYLINNDTAYLLYLKYKIDPHAEINEFLKEELKKRSWTVDDYYGRNFVQNFECGVCQRICHNNDLVKRNLPPKQYTSSVNHYGCPKPSPTIGGVEVKHNWWIEHWENTEWESKLLRRLVDHNKNYSSREYYSLLLDMLNDQIRV